MKTLLIVVFTDRCSRSDCHDPYHTFSDNLGRCTRAAMHLG